MCWRCVFVLYVLEDDDEFTNGMHDEKRNVYGVIVNEFCAWKLTMEKGVTIYILNRLSRVASFLTYIYKVFA